MLSAGFAAMFWRSRPWRALCFLVLNLLPSVPAQGQTSRSAHVTWQPAKLVNGSPVLFQVSTPANVQALFASWLGHELVFFRHANGRTWYALAGIPVETAAGRYDLRVRQTLAGGKSSEMRARVKITSAAYPKITIKVAKQFTEPSPAQLRGIAADKDLKQKAFAVETVQRLWAGPFSPPVSAGISDVFGTAPVINQEVKSRHLGLDYGVSVGTAVHAVNPG